jgi:polar amino acid transport system substrate-binding protein
MTASALDSLQATERSNVVRWTVIAGALGICALLAATASAQGTPPTKESGKLIVGFDLPAPGFWNGRASGTTIKNPSGFEYALSLAIAKQLGIGKKNVQFLRAPFGAILLAGSKKFDFALEETTITAQRAKVISFSAPYFDANQGVLISKGTPKPTRIAALKTLQTCAQAATTGLSWIQHKLRPTKNPLVYSASSSAAFDAVEAGRCQALILDVPIVVSQSKKKPGAYGGVVGQILTGEGYGAVMQKGSPLRPAVNRAIKKLRKNGTINRLQQRWLPFTRVKVIK